MLDTVYETDCTIAIVPVVSKDPTQAPITPDQILSDEYTRELIRHKARRIVRGSGFSKADREDVEQDLAVEILQKAAQFDPSRAALRTFIARVVNSSAVSIIRKRRRLKRAPGYLHRSLSEPVTAEGTASLGATLSDDDATRRLQGTRSSHVDHILRADGVARALASADLQLQTLYSNLEQGTVASVARDLGLSRGKRRVLLEASKPLFRKAGFGNSQE